MTNAALIDIAPARPGTTLERPYRLWTTGLSGHVFCGCYRTEADARGVARRRGLVLVLNRPVRASAFAFEGGWL